VTAKGEGKCYQWLLDHREYSGDYCLIWPFSTTRGYGRFSHLGKAYYAHTFMCELAHGPAPSPDHQPAHSCGMGDEGCTNPRHLSWKTASENQLDKRKHGTSMPMGRARFKLKPEDVLYIRSQAGQKTQAELARAFGVSRRNIGAILDGRSWGPTWKVPFYTPEDEAKIREGIERGLNFSQIGNLVGRSPAAVSGWAYRNGLRSGMPCERKTG